MDDYQFQQHRNLYNTIMYDRDDLSTCQVVRSIHLEGNIAMLNVRVHIMRCPLTVLLIRRSVECFGASILVGIVGQYNA